MHAGCRHIEWWHHQRWKDLCWDAITLCSIIRSQRVLVIGGRYNNMGSDRWTGRVQNDIADYAAVWSKDTLGKDISLQKYQYG